MKHPIESAFEKEMTRPGVSTFIAFTRAVRGRGFDRYKIGKFFNKLVDKEDYERRCRDSLILQITALSAPK
jgi:hypothetical protein